MLFLLNADLSLRFIVVVLDDIFNADLSAAKIISRTRLWSGRKQMEELVLPRTFNPGRSNNLNLQRLNSDFGSWSYNADFPLDCCQRWFSMDFWSRSGWYRKPIMSFINICISRSNEAMDNALLRKEIWHCVAVSCRQPHLRMKLKAAWTKWHSIYFRMGWVLHCLGYKRNASVDMQHFKSLKLQTIWTLGWKSEIISRCHRSGRSSDFTQPNDRVKR